MTLRTRESTELVVTSKDIETFAWRDREGNYHSPVTMETHHVFYTFRMIWNHYMPEEARTPGHFNKYRFSAPYTQKFMATAIQAMGAELHKRRDLEPSMIAELARMKAWFEGNLKRLYAN